MFNLTAQERRAIVFLCSTALAGIACSAYAARFPGARIPDIAEQSARLDINRVSAADLVRCRVAPRKLAVKIIEYRDALGRVERLEQLLEVKGVGPKRLKRLKSFCFAGP